jgi:hypothetical protein
MFAYDMLGTASRNLGWQTHYLSLVYTPRKAMSAVIAAEAMRRLPRGRTYGRYPANARFGDLRVSAEPDLAELVAADAFLYAGSTISEPPRPRALRRVAGYGSSTVVGYGGEGVYFLDWVRDGVWRLEVYPDAVPVRDPFEMPAPEKVVTRAVYRAWPMRVRLPDLGASFTVQPVTEGARGAQKAREGRFDVTPGVYVLSARGPVDRAKLPATIAGGALRFDEFHAPPPDDAPLSVEPLSADDHAAGAPVTVTARVAAGRAPDSVTLWVRAAGAGRFRPFPMGVAGAYEYRATIPAGTLGEGVYDYAISVARGDSSTTFPERLLRPPSHWSFHGQRFWRLRVVRADAPVRLFSPGEDADRMAFSRLGDAGRQGVFRVLPAGPSGEPAFRLALPGATEGRGAADYTASLVVKERLAARPEAMRGAAALVLRGRGLGPRSTVHVTLVERDGTAWSAAVALDSAWMERTIPLAELRPSRAVKLPQGFPGDWNYWLEPAAGRGGSGDAVRVADVERLQLSLRREAGAAAAGGEQGVEVESITLTFR